ncbi:unnamed protein product [Bursaphelenchus xylophilus]|uniref:(pine wood nematode) hypothetical protein n=1 Tax=Bursaphelenchus xylophilus TaxID=6326 RepID=A0A1I7RHP2_BURXY|nr:unnamed protein product [Bursaphelenchus xylophilus]CAG9115536.1 unnamed protein product [Bursaphelenchus xylophilus]
MSTIKRFLRDKSGICFHLHVQAQKLHLEKLNSEMKPFVTDDVVLLRLNLCLFMGNDKEVLQEIGRALDFPVSSVRVLEEVLDLYFGENPEKKLIFIMNNAEEMSQLKFSFIKELFFSFKERRDKIKVISVSTLPWMLVADSFDELLHHSTISYKFERFSQSDVEALCMEAAIQKNLKVESKLLRYVINLLPKNQDPFIIGKYVVKILERAQHENLISIVGKTDQWNGIVKRILDNKPRTRLSVQPIFDRLPHVASLTLIAAYFASYNPPSTDKRYFGERATGKRRAHQRTVVRENFHETGPKPFTLERLSILYSLLKGILLAECGDLDVNVQIPLLVYRGHLEKVSDIQNIILPKFRCVAPFDYVDLVKNDFIKLATKKTGTKEDYFDLRQYLHDFAFETQ